MSRSPCLSAISVAALALAGAAGCPSSPKCGVPAGYGATLAAPPIGTYAGFSASANNDCPSASAPHGVISLTITATQQGGTGFFTLCVPRPDLLGTMAQTLGTDVQVVDVSGTDASSCTYAFDPTTPPTAITTGVGMCNNGTSKAGFGLALQGNVTAKKTCGATVTSVTVQLDGSVAVAAM